MSQKSKQFARWDPTWARTAGIVTKVYHINDDKAGFLALIAGESRTLQYMPRGGWSPVRLRTAPEFKKKSSSTELEAQQKKMFALPLWRDLATRFGDFTWSVLQKSIHDRFESLVKQK
jgi:hypothetical protein